MWQKVYRLVKDPGSLARISLVKLLKDISGQAREVKIQEQKRGGGNMLFYILGFHLLGYKKIVENHIELSKVYLILRVVACSSKMTSLRGPWNDYKKLRHLKIILLFLLETKEEIDDTVAPNRDMMMNFSH